jgi:hypothetical protein
MGINLPRLQDHLSTAAGLYLAIFDKEEAPITATSRFTFHAAPPYTHMVCTVPEFKASNATVLRTNTFTVHILHPHIHLPTPIQYRRLCFHAPALTLTAFSQRTHTANARPDSHRISTSYSFLYAAITLALRWRSFYPPARIESRLNGTKTTKIHTQ